MSNPHGKAATTLLMRGANEVGERGANDVPEFIPGPRTTPTYKHKLTHFITVLELKLQCRVKESWLGGEICLGMYAEAIEYIRYMMVYDAENHPRTPTSTTKNRIRGSYEDASYRDDDDDDDDDDERP